MADSSKPFSFQQLLISTLVRRMRVRLSIKNSLGTHERKPHQAITRQYAELIQIFEILHMEWTALTEN
jgi:hypothetical protein